MVDALLNNNEKIKTIIAAAGSGDLAKTIMELACKKNEDDLRNEKKIIEGGLDVEVPKTYLDFISELNDLVDDEEEEVVDDICSLKKQIKHCKNPLEKINLQRRLNEAYKKSSKKRR